MKTASSIQTTTSRAWSPAVDYRNGWTLREPSGSTYGIWLGPVTLRADDDRSKELPFTEYLTQKKLSLGDAIPAVRETAKTLRSFLRMGRDEISSARLMGRADFSRLLSELTRAGEKLRGMKAGATIVLDYRYAIRAGNLTGYVPKSEGSRVTYPHAQYRDGDFGDILIYPGDPVIERHETRAEEAYPTSFTKVGRPKKLRDNPIFAVAFRVRNVKARTPSRGWGIFGSFG